MLAAQEGATILIEEPPEIEFREQHVYIIDRCGIRRAMPRSVAIATYARFAERLREDRLSIEARAKLAVNALPSAEVIKFSPK
jgi:hypothetical protein